MNDLFVYILAGGAGARLWPLSQPRMPKQFLAMGGGGSLLQETIKRHGFSATRPTILTTAAYQDIAKSQVVAIGFAAHIISEQEAAGTLTSAFAAALDALSHHYNPYILLAPADHYITSTEQYYGAIQEGYQLCMHHQFVMFGVAAAEGYPGYGYMEKGVLVQGSETGYTITAFHEKPDRTEAIKLLQSGNCLWNTGIFMVNARYLLQLTKELVSGVYEQVQHAYSQATHSGCTLCLGSYHKGADLSYSLDRSICEKTLNAVVVVADFTWHDLGSWFGVQRWLISQSKKNKSEAMVASKAPAIQIDTENCFFWTDKFVAAIGIRNIAVIESGNELLALDLADSERVSDITSQLPFITKISQNDELCDQKVDTNNSTPIIEHKPWGYVLYLSTNGRDCTIKQLYIMPKQQLSLQYHRYREEHWIIISGHAKVVLGEEVHIFSAPQYIHITTGVPHRITNVGSAELIVLEVQLGEWLSEMDVVRIADDYGRA